MMPMRTSRISKLLAAAVFTGVVASCDDPTRPTVEASIEPRIQLIQADSATRASLVLPLTEVRVRTFGPTGRVVPLTLVGGVWRGTITGLEAGDYELVIEGLANNQVQYYGRLPNITVARGQRAQPTVQFAAAVPVVTNPPLQNTTNFSQRVPFAAIPSATGYVVQVSQDNNFVNGVTEFAAPDTNPLVNVTQPGTWFIRSRAVLPQVPASSIPWSDVRSWVVRQATGGNASNDGQSVPLVPETPQTIVDRNLTANKREDWYDIALQQGDSLIAETFAARLLLPSGLNTTLALFRNDGTTEVAQNLDATATTDSRLVHVAASSETFKLRVGASSNTNGHYELRSEIRRLPLAPSALVATVVSGTAVSLVWGDNANNETSYRIERCAGVGCTDFAEVGTTATNVSSSSQTGLTQGTTYLWRVRARNNVGNSNYSNSASTALVGPAAPTTLAATTLSNTSVRLTWTDVATNETGYEIQRCVAGGSCSFAALASVGANIAEYVDATAVYNTSYQYQVRATNSVVPSAFTAPVSANTVPPARPTGLLAQVTGPTTINLSWTDASANETHFLIERCLGPACGDFTQVDSVSAGITAYASTVANNAAYRFRIRARNAVISLTYSDTAAANTFPPDAPSALVATTLGATAIQLTWTDNVATETGFRVERCASGAECTDFATIATTAAGAVTYSDNTAVLNTSYRYRVTSIGIAGNSAPSNIAVANTLLPAAPSGLVATVITANVIRLAWADNATNETGYTLGRCAGAACTNFTTVKALPAGSSTTDDSTAVAGQQYTYRINASNVAGASAVSNSAVASTLPPSAPTGFAAVLVSATRVDLNWLIGDASTIGTRVERCTGAACADFAEITFVAGSGNTHSDLTVTAGNFYRYRLRAQNAADVSAYTAIVDVNAGFMSKPAGANAVITAPTPQITMGWTASTGPGLTGYQIFRCIGADCTNFTSRGQVGAGQTNFAESVSLNTEYRYIVHALNLVGAGPFSDTVYINTLQPTTPTGVAATLRPGAVRITWTDNSNNENQSVVERCEGSGCLVFTAVGAPVAANVTSFDDATAVAGVTYSYRVIASNLLGSTPASAAVSVTPFLPGAPSTLAASTVSGTQINLTWTDNSLNENGTEIRRCSGVSCSTFVAIDSVDANITAFSDASVTAGQSYTYAVAAYAAFGTSTASSAVTVTTLVPAAPTVLTAQTLSNTSIRLNWTDNSNNETGFAVQKCAGAACTVPAGSFATVAAGTTEYTDTGLASNQTFSYHVFALNTVGNSAVTNVATATTNVPAIPGAVAGNVTAPNSVRISWTDIATNEDGYKVERCESAACVFAEIYLGVTADETEFTDTGVNDGTTYQYRVRAYGAAGNSDYAAAVIITAGEPLTPLAASALASSATAIRVTWTDASDNEDGFLVERCSTVSCAVIVASANVARNVSVYTDATVTVGNEYFYRITASNGAGPSAPTATLSANTFLPDAPTGLSASTFSSTQVDLAWTDNGPNETGVEIQRCAGPGCSSFAAVDTAAANAVSYSDIGLTSGLSFSYRVRAINGVGQSAFTSVVTAATNLPAAPSNVTALIDNPTDVSLNWTDNASNEDEFFIERCEGSNCTNFAFLSNVGAGVTSYNDPGLTTGSIYRYRVQASNGAGVSPFAPVAEAALVVPALPTGFSATVTSGTRVNLAWTDAATNELSYQIERCAGAGCSSFALRSTRAANAVTYVDTVGVDSTYSYQIRALNNVGASAYVASAEVNTIRPDLPTDFVVTTFSATQVDLTWTDVATNESGYLVERCAGVSCSTFDTLIVLSADKSSHQDQGLSAQESYSYRISAFNVAGNRGTVGPLSATTIVPALPTAFAGIAQSATQINLSWTDAASNELGYRVERCAGGGCSSFVEVGTVGANQTSFVNTGLVLNTIYRFRLRAFNAAGTSAYTTVLQVLTSAPATPSTLAATVLTVSEVQLTFTDASTNETGFTVQRCLTADCVNFTDLTTLPAGAGGVQTYVDNTLSAGQLARYRVRSFNNVGTSSSTTNVATASTEVPAVPSAAAAFPQGQTQMFVQWSDNASNEGGYIVERCLGQSCTNFAAIDTTTAPPASITDVTVTGGNFYRYRVRAIGNGTSSFGASAYSNEALASTIIPANPSALTADAVSDNRVNIAWTNNANNADDFRVFRCSVAACVPAAQIGVAGGGNVVTYVDSTVSANTLYRYSVSATNGAGESGVTNVAETGTFVPGLPTALAAVIISGSEVQLTWTDNASTETGFEIERCEGIACTNFVNIFTAGANSVSYNDTGLADSTLFRYRIRATTGTAFSGYTAPVAASTAPPTGPASVLVTPGATNLVLGWTDAATDETSYEVERCLGTGCTNFVSVSSLAANAVSFSEAWLVDTVYRYRVRAVNAAGPSAYGNVVTQSTYRPLAPASFTAATSTATSINLQWTSGSANSGGFRLFRCVGPSCIVAEVRTFDSTATAHLDESLATASVFTYDLLAYNIFGNGPRAGEVTATTDFPAVPASLVVSTVSASRIELQWSDASTNETGFEIYRCLGAGCTPNSLLITAGAGVQSFADLSVVIGNVYRYHVRAVNGAGASPATSVSEANTLVPVDPASLEGLPLSPSSARVQWIAQANTAQYRIERCDTPGCVSYTALDSVAHPTNAFTDNSVVTGETYGYRVRGLNAAGASAGGASVEVAMLTPSSVSSLAAVALSGTQVLLNWADNSSNELGFVLSRCSGGGCSDFVLVDSIAANDTSYVDATVAFNERYVYQLVAYNNVGSEAPPTIQMQTTAPDAPSNLVATTTAPGTVDLTWTLPVTNEISVAVERCAGAACINFSQIQLLGAGTDAYQDTGLPTNVVWRYQVRTINNVGPSDYSNVDQANTIVPTVVENLATTQVNGQRIDLSWTDGALEQGYVVERCDGLSCTSFTEIATLPANTTSYVNNTGVVLNAAYTYRVTGRNVAGLGVSSSPVVVEHALNAPESVRSRVLNRTQVLTQWAYAPNMQQYSFQVLRCVGAGCDPATGTVRTTVSSATLEYAESVAQGQDVTYAVRAVTLGGTSNAPSGPSARTPINLASAVAVTGVSDLTLGERHYVFNVPADALALRVRMDSPSGDADLYVKFGETPTTNVTLNDATNCVPYTGATPEICTFTAPAAGDWYAMLQAFSTYGGATLKASLAERFGWPINVANDVTAFTTLLVSHSFTITEPTALTHLGLRLAAFPLGTNVRVGLYSSRAPIAPGVAVPGEPDQPDQLLTQIDITGAVVGVNELAVSEIVLQPGKYWLASVANQSATYGNSGQMGVYRFFAATSGFNYGSGFPAVWPAADLTTNFTRHNIFIRGFR